MSDDVRLLDSSIVIRHFRQGGMVTSKLETFTTLYLPSVALGERHGGAIRSARPEKNLVQIEAFVAGVVVIPVDDETAKFYGRISAQLAAQGTPIPQNDMWIAACAMQLGVTVATADAHYLRVDNLSCEPW
jgi:tRNA(fMet)-specific endonuclease VapC